LVQGQSPWPFVAFLLSDHKFGWLYRVKLITMEVGQKGGPADAVLPKAAASMGGLPGLRGASGWPGAGGAAA
jgi:hypothetical protein